MTTAPESNRGRRRRQARETLFCRGAGAATLYGLIVWELARIDPDSQFCGKSLKELVPASSKSRDL